MVSLVALATPLFVASIACEILSRRLRRGRVRYEARDTAASLILGIGGVIVNALPAGAIVAASFAVYEHRLFTVPESNVLGWIAAFLLGDLTYHWFHRFSHGRRYWWASHVAHHSSQHFNFATALRQTWTAPITLN